MNILVTGGAGFIGTNLIKRLLSEGHSVVCIDNYHTGLEENHQLGCKYIRADLQSIFDYGALGEFNIVYHLAAMARIQPSFKHPDLYFKINVGPTLKLAQYCANNNIPLIFAGSSSHHSGRFKNPYTFSKDVAEDVIKLYQTHYKLKASIARFYNVYGPYHLRTEGYSTLIGAWENKIQKEEPLVIYGDGTKRRDFTHVDDIVDGLVKIQEKEAWGYIFELGRGENYSVKEIADMFGVDVVYRENKPGEAQDTLCTNDLAKTILGWEPKKNIRDYIKQYTNENIYHSTSKK